MLFNSFEFIFVYLPIIFFGYVIAARFIKNPLARLLWLAAASLVFYGYWNYHFLPIIVISIIANYFFGFLISTLPKDSLGRKSIFAFSIFVNLAVLGFYKYANFGMEIFDSLLKTPHETLAVVLPLGISFFTFTQIAYLADTYRGYTVERNLIKYVLFVTYFPHLIAGPIMHHGEMMPQFGSEKSRHISAERIALGLTVFIIGLFKKVIIADGFSAIANPVFKAAITSNTCTADAWGGALAYALQIYFDFSGYSDMAIGLSCLFGIALPFNFDAPYKSQSIIEFWRRWHITLSRFLRDYVYISLGGNRCGVLRRNINIAITMLVGGLWHGAGWTFIVWGGLHGLFLLVNHGWVAIKNRIPLLISVQKLWLYPIFCLLLTQICVTIAWVYFRADSLKTAHRILTAMLCGNGIPATSTTSIVSSAEFALIILFYLACICLPNVNAICDRWNIGLDTYKLLRPWSIFSIKWTPTAKWAITSVFLFLIALLGIAANNASPFLYFQF